MKLVLDLEKALKSEGFRLDQTEYLVAKKNILYVSPQLSARGLYQSVMPFFLLGYMGLRNSATAMTSLSRYNYTGQLVEYDINLVGDEAMQHISWADYIVFPFTACDLVPLYGLVRKLNPKTKIVFMIDFNFYEIPADNPLSTVFTKELISTATNNYWQSDLIFVNNALMVEYLTKKIKQLVDRRTYTEFNAWIQPLPFVINRDIMTENFDVDSIEQPEYKSFIVPSKKIDNKKIASVIAASEKEAPEKQEKNGRKSTAKNRT